MAEQSFDDQVVAEMLRLAAEASRDIQSQATGQTEWFSWVPKYLDRLADLIAPASGDHEAGDD